MSALQRVPSERSTCLAYPHTLCDPAMPAVSRAERLFPGETGPLYSAVETLEAKPGFLVYWAEGSAIGADKKGPALSSVRWEVGTALVTNDGNSVRVQAVALFARRNVEGKLYLVHALTGAIDAMELIPRLWTALWDQRPSLKQIEAGRSTTGQHAWESVWNGAWPQAGHPRVTQSGRAFQSVVWSRPRPAQSIQSPGISMLSPILKRRSVYDTEDSDSDGRSTPLLAAFSLGSPTAGPTGLTARVPSSSESISASSMSNDSDGTPMPPQRRTRLTFDTPEATPPRQPQATSTPLTKENRVPPTPDEDGFSIRSAFVSVTPDTPMRPPAPRGVIDTPPAGPQASLMRSLTFWSPSPVKQQNQPRPERDEKYPQNGRTPTRAVVSPSVSHATPNSSNVLGESMLSGFASPLSSSSSSSVAYPRIPLDRSWAVAAADSTPAKMATSFVSSANVSAFVMPATPVAPRKNRPRNQGNRDDLGSGQKAEVPPLLDTGRVVFFGVSPVAGSYRKQLVAAGSYTSVYMVSLRNGQLRALRVSKEVSHQNGTVYEHTLAWASALNRMQTTVDGYAHFLPFTDSVWWEDGHIYNLMEIGQASMKQVVDNIEDADERIDVVRDVLHDVAETLQWMGPQTIVHQDIKPDNIVRFFNSDGSSRWKLIDLDGLVRTGESVDVLTHHTQQTGAYQAPELIMKGASATNASDVYSLGAACFKILTGMSRERVRAVDSPEGPDDLSPLDSADAVPSWLQALIRGMMAADTAKRMSPADVLLRLQMAPDPM
jgi:hypothetical protein